MKPQPGMQLFSTILTICLLVSGCGGGGSSDGGDNGGNDGGTNPPPSQQPPVADAGPDNTVNEMVSVQLVGSGSDPDGSIVSVLWRQTGGPAVSLSATDRYVTSFTAPQVNTNTALTFELSVTDDDGLSKSDTVIITVSDVNNIPPVADAGDDKTVAEQTTVTLSGSGSDSDGSVTSFVWRQLEGDPVVLTNSNQATAEFVSPDIADVSVLTFELAVTDNDGAVATDTVAITITPANNQVIAATGLPAADFPDGFVYWSVYTPTIGANGHIAMPGIADVSVASTGQNTNAIWTGMPGQLKTIVRENDPIPGLPSNVLFDGVLHTSATPLPIVTPAGSVAFSAALKGAVNNDNRAIVLAYINEQLYPVVRTGDQARGMPAGITIGTISHYAFTDVGLVYQAMVKSTSGGFAEGIWLWTPDGTQLIAAGDLPGIDMLELPEEEITIDGQVCRFVNLEDLHPVQMNQAGQIAFASMLGRPDGELGCPIQGVLLWDNGTINLVAGNGDAVPGFSGYSFRLDLSFAAHHPFNLGPQGQVSMIAPIVGNNELRYSAWVFDRTGNIDLISVDGELLPNDAGSVLTNNGVLGAPLATDNFSYLFQGITSQPDGLVFLSGEAIPNPYTDTANTGGSHLQQLVRQGDVPNGFADTFYFSNINPDVKNRWQLSGQGEVYFAATRSDALAINSATYGLWKMDSNGVANEVIAVGDAIEINGQEGIVQHLFYYAGKNGRQLSNWQGGYPRHFSDTEQWLVEAQLSNADQAVLLLNP